MTMMMLKKVIIMPVVMNDRRDDDHRQIYGSTNAPQVPPKPRSTHLPVILAARCTIPHTLLCHILYCAAYCTGQPPTLVTQRNRAQTAPPDCSQTRLKSDQKTTPTSDSVYLSEQPLHRIRVAKRHSCYTDNKLSLIFDPKKRVICDWYIFATNPVNPGQSKSFSFGLLHSSPNLIFS